MFNRVKNKILNSESGNIIKGMFTLFLGAGSARIVGLISIPILARLYSPEDYGVLALYVSLVSILVPLMTLRYVQAIPLPKGDALAFNLLSLCVKLIIISTLLISIVLAAFGVEIMNWFNMGELVPWRWLIVVGAAGTAFYELLTLWATRKRDYGLVARTQFMQSLVGNIFKIFLGLLAFKPSGILIGQFISQSAGITMLLTSARRDFNKNIAHIKFKKEMFVAKIYQGFLWFRLPSQFLMVISLQAPILITARIYDANITGQFSFTMMALLLPSNLIAAGISRAYYAEIAAVGRKEPAKIKRITIDIQKKLFLLGLPIAISIYLFSESLFVILFGESWRMAGVFSSILAPYVLLKFTSSSLDQVFNVIGNQAIYLLINGLRIVGFVLIYFYCLNNELDVLSFVRILSVFMTSHYLFVSILVLVFVHSASVRER